MCTKVSTLLKNGVNRNFDRNFRFLTNNFDFWRKFRFLIKTSIFDQNFEFWPNYQFLTKTSIFDPNLDFWPKLRFLTKTLIFDQNFDFWPKLRFLTKTLIFDQSFYSWPKLRFLTKKLIFDQKFDFWPKLRFLVKNLDPSKKRRRNFGEPDRRWRVPDSVWVVSFFCLISREERKLKFAWRPRSFGVVLIYVPPCTKTLYHSKIKKRRVINLSKFENRKQKFKIFQKISKSNKKL